MKKLTVALLSVLMGVSLSFAQSTVKWQETFDSPQVPSGWQIINNDGSAIHPDTGADAWFWTSSVLDGNGNAEISPQAGQIFCISTFKHANGNGLISWWSSACLATF